MAINSSPDKLEQNNPSDEVKDNLDSIRDDSHLFQSDVDLEAIDTIASNVAKEDTVEENTTCHDPTNPVDKFSKTDILEVQLPYERSDSSGSVKNAPRKSEELVISNLEDYCSGDRGEMLTVLEIINVFLRISTGNVDNAEIIKGMVH